MNNKITVTIPFGTEPNKNGRIYTKETVEKIVESVNDTNLPYFITEPCLEFDPNNCPNLDKAIGIVKSATLQDDNRVDFECKVNDETLKLLENGIKVVPNGVGDINPETKEVTDYGLKFFSISADSAFE